MATKVKNNTNKKQEFNPKRYDLKLIQMAKLYAKSGGRLSEKEAEKFYSYIRKNGRYTIKQKNSMAYIRQTFKFTVKADTFFRFEMRKWAAERGYKARRKAIKNKSKNKVMSLSSRRNKNTAKKTNRRYKRAA